MKAVIIIYFYVAILPLMIHGNAKLLGKLNEMANQNGSIDGIFQPAEGGYLGIGAFALTFKGILLKLIDREVAMKFTPLKKRAMAEREYETYTYLGAINNTDVEQYGIPTVYYYGKWEDYIVMAITLMDLQYAERCRNRTLKDVDILIIAREFVRISKYIHSRGVHHSDMKLDNLMFRKHQGFLIDFNIATTLYRKHSLRRFGIPPEDVFEDRRRYALEDWSSFLCAVCTYTHIDYKWFDKCALCKLRYEDPNQYTSLKNGIPHKNNQFDKEEFRQAFVEFFFYKHKLADCYQNTTRFQLYDKLYQIISAKIDKFDLPKPVFVSWLNDDERENAEKELKNRPLPDISSIKDRFVNVHAKYPKHPMTPKLDSGGELTKPSSTTSTT